MPERHVFQCCQGVGPDHPGEPADLFTADRVPFMGHGRRTFLSSVKGLFHFSGFSFLESADLGGQLVQGSGRNGQRRHELGMPIPLEDLGGDRGRF